MNQNFLRGPLIVSALVLVVGVSACAVESEENAIGLVEVNCGKRYGCDPGDHVALGSFLEIHLHEQTQPYPNEPSLISNEPDVFRVIGATDRTKWLVEVVGTGDGNLEIINSTGDSLFTVDLIAGFVSTLRLESLWFSAYASEPVTPYDENWKVSAGSWAWFGLFGNDLLGSSLYGYLPYQLDSIDGVESPITSQDRETTGAIGDHVLRLRVPSGEYPTSLTHTAELTLDVLFVVE